MNQEEENLKLFDSVAKVRDCQLWQKRGKWFILTRSPVMLNNEDDYDKTGGGVVVLARVAR